MEAVILKELYEKVLTIRRFEQSAIEQYRLGNIYGYLHPYTGEEAIAVGTISALKPNDYIVSTHRGHGHAIAKGHDLALMMAELFGKSKSVPDRMLTSYRIFEKLSIMQVSTSEGNNDEWENCRWESGDSKNTCVKFCSNCNENLVID